ncbi:unnamed protein product [Arctogadus glacialis]
MSSGVMKEQISGAGNCRAAGHHTCCCQPGQCGRGGRAGPLMKQRVSDSVRLIGQVCPGLRLPAFEVSSEAPPRQPYCSRSSSSAAAAAAATTAARLSLTPAAQTATAPPALAP